MANGIILKGKVEGFNKVQRELNQTTRATKKMGRAQKAVGASSAAMSAGMATMASALNPVTLAITAAVAAFAAGPVAMAAFAVAVKKVASAGIDLSADLDKIGKKAKNLGVAAEEMQLVIGALELSGVSAEASMKAFTKLGKIIGDELVKGPGAAADALDELGLSALAIDKMGLREKMLKIAKGMEGIESQSKKNAVATALFGKAGGEMLEAFKSRDALEAAIRDMEKYGVATTAQIQASEDLQDELLRLKKVTFKLKVDAFDALIPTIGAVTRGIQNYARAASKTGDIKSFGEAVAQMITPDVVRGMTAMIGLMGTMVLVLKPASTLAAAFGEAMAGNLKKAYSLSTQAQLELLLIPFALPKAQEEMEKLADSINAELEKLRKGFKETKKVVKKTDKEIAADLLQDFYALEKGLKSGEISGETSLRVLQAHIDTMSEFADDRSIRAAKDYGAAVQDSFDAIGRVWPYKTSKEQLAWVDKWRDRLGRTTVLLEKAIAKNKQLGKGTTGLPGGAPRAPRPIDPYYIELAALDDSLEAHKLAERSKQQALDETFRARLAFLKAGVTGEKAAWKMTEQDALDRLHKVIEWHDIEQSKLDEMKLEKARALNQELKKIDEEETARLRQLAEERKLALESQVQAAASTMDSLGSIASTIGGLITSVYGENNEEAKKAAKVAFGLTQSLALASAVVQTSSAITAALANPPGPPYSIPQAVAAGAAGAAQIATIIATSIQGVADAGLAPGALKQAGLNQHSLIAMRNDEMILDPVGTAAISRMLEGRAAGGQQSIQVRTTLELDGRVLGRVVDNHLVRSAERGGAYQNRIRYGSRN